MPKFLETKLKAEYGQNSKAPYKIMNALGAMKGNKETAKGRAMEAKHALDTKAKHNPIGNLGKYAHKAKGHK